MSQSNIEFLDYNIIDKKSRGKSRQNQSDKFNTNTTNVKEDDDHL